MAADLGVQVKTVQLWFFRDSIPSRYWADIIAAGGARGIKLSSDEMLRIDARSRENIPRMPRQPEARQE